MGSSRVPLAHLPRENTVTRLRAKRKKGYGVQPTSNFIDGTVLVVGERGVVMRDLDGKVHAIRASRILDFTPFVPGQADGPLFDGKAMQDHIRQSGRPPMDMIGNPAPRESSW